MESEVILTAKQQRFIEEYLVDFNGAQAAIRAGYSKKTAREMACQNLKKPEIKKAIDEKMAAMSLSAEETTKLINDIARSSLNDYFIVRKVEHTPRIEVSLAEIIRRIQEEIEFEEEYAGNVELKDDELDRHNSEQAQRRKDIIRLQLELKRNPAATRVIDGPTEWREEAVLDMVKLVADKERGRIKSIAPGQFGLKVEMYAADAALRDLAKIHGLFEKDNEQSRPVFPTVTKVEIVRPKEDD